MSFDYQFWLSSDAGKQKNQLPVNPEKFTIKNGSNNDKINIAGLGEITIIQNRPALQFSFSSFFPFHLFTGIKGRTNFWYPLVWIQRINAWKNSGKPIHFIVTGCGIDLYCTIESFTYYQQGGDPGTYQYDITLKEYREITVRRVNISDQKASVQNTQKRVDNTQQSKTYTVVKGDCLWNLAKKFYGDGSEYKKIYEANKNVIGNKNPNLIVPGQILKIP